MDEKDSPSSNVGWRFAAGVVLIVGGYVAWTFIPVVVATELSTGAKSVLTALLGATPFMTKIAAVAIMGKPGLRSLQAHRAEIPAGRPGKLVAAFQDP